MQRKISTKALTLHQHIVQFLLVTHREISSYISDLYPKATLGFTSQERYRVENRLTLGDECFLDLIVKWQEGQRGFSVVLLGRCAGFRTFKQKFEFGDDLSPRAVAVKLSTTFSRGLTKWIEQVNF